MCHSFIVSQDKSREAVVNVVTGLRTLGSVFRILTEASNISVIQFVLPGRAANRASCPIDTSDWRNAAEAWT